MERKQVKSSFIESIGYEAGILECTFKDGKVYRYEGVPSDLFEVVMGAESIGKAFKENIANGGFTVDRVEPD